MEDPLKGITPAKADEFEDASQLRSMTDSYVFCPKCGMKNTFKLSSTGKRLIYFCSRCSTKLNPIWDGYYEDKMQIANCRACQQFTFRDLKYCISCGSQQRVVAHKRSKAISSQIRDTSIDSLEGTLIAYDCCASGTLVAFFGLIFRRALGRLPKTCAYICAAVAVIFLVLFLVLWFTLWRNLG